MATLLHVSASPLHETSFSSRIAAAFVDAWRKDHPDGVVDTVNVWSEPLPAFDHLEASWKVKVMDGRTPAPEEVAAFERTRVVAERFLAADAYLVSCPMWNFHIPYALKHYLDVLVQPGLTFGFDPARGYFGLVPDRPVQLVLTRGGSYAAGSPMASMDFQRPYLEAILGFIGLTDVRTLVMECTAYGPAVAAPLLEQAIIDAHQAASRF